MAKVKFTNRFTKNIDDKYSGLSSNQQNPVQVKKDRYESYRFSNLFEQAPFAIAILKGPKHIYEFSNPLANKILKVKNPIGKSVKELFPDNKAILELLDATYKSGKSFTVSEYPINIKGKGNSSEIIYVNATYQPLRDTNNNIIGIMTTGFDVTGQVKARQKLLQFAQNRENEGKRLEFGQKAGRIGTYEWDLITNKSFWTKEFEALYGYPNGGFKAGNPKSWLKMLHPDDRKWVMDQTAVAIESSSEINLEYRVIWPDKSVHYLASRAQIIRDEVGKAIRINGVNIDITERKIIENKLEFLSRASKILASSLEYKTTLANVAKLAVPEIADWCSVTIKNGTELETIAVAHKDPKKIKWAEELQKKNPPDPNAKTGVARVLRTGKSERYPQISDDMLVATARNKDELALLRKLKISSVMIVPLLLAGKAIGTISFVAAESGHHYSEHDLKIAEEVASRMALAIENARLFSDAKTADEMQKRLAAVVESSDDAIISQSNEGIITTWNKGAEQLYGYKEHEVVGRPVSILMPPEKKDDFQKFIKYLQQGRKMEHYVTKRRNKNGKILDVSITLSPIRSSDGRMIGASKVTRDITQQKKSEERQQFLEQASALLGSSIEYETTLKNLGKLIVPILADYCRIVVLDENLKIKEITVHHKDRKKLFLVKELYEAYKDSDTSGVGRLIATGKSELMSSISPALLQTASPQIQELITQLNLKSYMGAPMKIGNRVIGAITFSSTSEERTYTKDDVSLAEELARRAALAIENARLYSDSQKAVALRDEFISVASHELKTPVTSLKMYVHLMKKHLIEKSEDVRNIEKMDYQIKKLTLLIEDLLNVARFQSGKLEYHDENFDLHNLINEIVDEIQPTTAKHIITIDGFPLKKVWGDKDRIGQVLSNLLTNAIKYSPNSNKIIVRLTPEKDFAVVSVQDFGIGIDKKHLGKLFDRFYRVSDPREKTFPGLGIGLYISNEIIKRYGGEISVVSSKGKGSQFSFTLPYQPQIF